jgi:mannose/fructose-specific phosphotransferase system component IIA
MEKDLRDALNRLEGCGEVIFFSDLHGGSCSLICKRLLAEYENLTLITGYNLPMLIEFAFHRSRPLEEALSIIAKKGQSGIKVFRHPGK